VGGAGATSASVAGRTSSRGKNATNDADPMSHTAARVAATGLANMLLMSRLIRPGSDASDTEAAAPDTMKMPITLTYIVRHSGQAFCRTKKEA
jgi:hypothetical protein